MMENEAVNVQRNATPAGECSSLRTSTS